MAISISPVRAEDVDLLVRKVEFPAHQDSPLNLLIFPRSKERQPEQIEDEVRWMIDGLREAVYREDESLYKACGEDGLPVGLIGWTTSSGVPGACAARQGSKVMSTSSCIPSSLDVESWLGVSKTLREERRRVLRDFHDNGVYRTLADNLNVRLSSNLHASLRGYFHGRGSKSSETRYRFCAPRDVLSCCRRTCSRRLCFVFTCRYSTILQVRIQGS